MVPPVTFYMVGSAIRGEEPRDIDIIGALHKNEFRKIYGYTHEEFMKAVNMEDPPQAIVNWKRDCKMCGVLLSSIFGRYVDFKWLSESMAYEPKKEIDLCFDWRGFRD